MNLVFSVYPGLLNLATAVMGNSVAQVALTIIDAAKAIDHASRSQLYRLIQDGRLDNFVLHENGRRLIEVNGLAAAVREATQQRINSVMVTEAADPVNRDAIAER